MGAQFKTHCRQGHPLTADNLAINTKGERRCRACKRIAAGYKGPQPVVSVEEKFWAKVDKTPGQGPQGECWQWLGSTNADGYGTFYVKEFASHLAHRISLIMDKGELDTKTLACHTCDNPACVRPSHLFSGTHQDNLRDMVAKGRCANVKQSHCKRGHELSGENLFYRSNGSRECKACHYLRRKKSVLTMRTQ